MLRKVRNFLNKRRNTDRTREIRIIGNRPTFDELRHQCDIADKNRAIQDFNSKQQTILSKIEEVRRFGNKYKSVLETNSFSNTSVDEYCFDMQKEVDCENQFLNDNKNDLTISDILQTSKDIDAYNDNLCNKLRECEINVLEDFIRSTHELYDKTLKNWKSYHKSYITQSKIPQDFIRQHRITARELNNAYKRKEDLAEKKLLPDAELSLTLQKLTTCQTDLLSTFKPLEKCWKALSEFDEALQATGDTLNKAKKYYKHEKYHHKYEKELSAIEKSACFQNLGKTIQETKHILKISNDELGKIKTLNEMHEKNNDLSPYPLAAGHFLVLSQQLSYWNDKLSNQRAEFQSKIKETIPNLYAEEMLDDLSNTKIIKHYTNVNNKLYHFLNGITTDPINRRSEEINKFQGISLANTLSDEKAILECIAREQEKDLIQQLQRILNAELQRKQNLEKGTLSAKALNNEKRSLERRAREQGKNPIQQLQGILNAELQRKQNLEKGILKEIEKVELKIENNKLKNANHSTNGSGSNSNDCPKEDSHLSGRQEGSDPPQVSHYTTNYVKILKNRISDVQATIATINQEISNIEDNKWFFQTFMMIKEIGIDLQLTKEGIQDKVKTVQSDKNMSELEKSNALKSELDLIGKLRSQTTKMLAVKNISLQQEVKDCRLQRSGEVLVTGFDLSVESNLIAHQAEKLESDVINGFIMSMSDIGEKLQKSDEEKLQDSIQYSQLKVNWEYLKKVKEVDNHVTQTLEDNFNKRKEYIQKEENRLQKYNDTLDLLKKETNKFAKILQLDSICTKILYNFICTKPIENFAEKHNMQNWLNNIKREYNNQALILNKRDDQFKISNDNINKFQNNYNRDLKANQSEMHDLNKQEKELEAIRKHIVTNQAQENFSTSATMTDDQRQLIQSLVDMSGDDPKWGLD